MLAYKGTIRRPSKPCQHRKGRWQPLSPPYSMTKPERECATRPSSCGLTTVVSAVLAAMPAVLLPGLSFHFDIAPKVVLLLLGTAVATLLWRGSGEGHAGRRGSAVPSASGYVRRLVARLNGSFISAGAFVHGDKLAAAGAGVSYGFALLHGDLSGLAVCRPRASAHPVARHCRRRPFGFLLRHWAVFRCRPAVAL